MPRFIAVAAAIGHGKVIDEIKIAFVDTAKTIAKTARGKADRLMLFDIKLAIFVDGNVNIKAIPD